MASQMLQENSTAPSGGRGQRRGGRHASGRIQGRGGIQKRNATPTRIDKDGDLVMGSSGTARASGSGAGRGAAIRGVAQSRRQGTPDGLQARVSSRPTRTGIDPSAVQKAVLRGMVSNDASSRGTRASARLSRRRETGDEKEDGLESLRIWGLKNSKAVSNMDGGVSDLVAFIERKTNHPNSSMVKIKQSRVVGDAVIIKVLPEDASRVLRLNEYTFAGAVLKIELLFDKQEDNTSSQTIDVLKAVLNRRYSSETKLLDLSNLGADPDLVSMGMFNTTSRESKFFPALMKVCDANFASGHEKEEAVHSITLANNNLPDIRSVTALAQTFPALRNLDLSSNQIKDLGALDGWRWKFRKLEHIILSNNPIEASEPMYKTDVIRWYPTLQFLNSERIRSVEEANAATKDELPLPILGPSFHDEASIAETFVKNFFPAYDSDRLALVNGYYDAQSNYSLSINTSAPRDDSQQPAPWDQYIKRSRNLTKLDHTSAQMSRLYTGTESIANAFTTLPTTRHPDFLNEPQKWCVECHTIPGLPDPSGQSASGIGGLIVMVHGEFSEIDVSTGQEKHKRSFDRTFILGPGSGIGGIRVANDILSLRAYGGIDAWKPQGVASTPLFQAVPVAPLQVPQQYQITVPEGFGTAGPGKSEEQVKKEAVAIELSKATGMTLEYSGMCLEQSGWNLEGAAAAFEQARANLPPEAFIAV